MLTEKGGKRMSEERIAIIDGCLYNEKTGEVCMQARFVQKLVRCADCKWFDITDPSGTVEPIGYKCKRKQRFVESDDFCKYGEAREE